MADVHATFPIGTQARLGWAFVERQTNLWKRHWAWEVVWLLYGVVNTLAELSKYVRMAIVTTAKRVDFEIIHEKRQIRQFMDFVLVRDQSSEAPDDGVPRIVRRSRST